MQKFVRETNSQKWSSKAITNEQYVLTIADMDFALPNHFKKAIINKIQLTNNFTYKSLSKQYYEAIINWYSHRHIRSPKIKIYPQDIVEAPSILNIIYLTIQHFTKEGDGVLITTPIFAYYRKIILQLKRRPVQSRLYNERKANITRYDINFADLEQKAKQCKLMIFCNPHNPTGRLWNKRQTEKVVSICKNNNLLLISDQILCDLVPQKYLSQFYSLANSDYENIIICNSISKAFNAQSLKGGYAIIKNKEIRDKYNHIIDSLSIHLNQIAMGVTEIYYTQQGRDWIQKTNEIIQKNYDYLLEKLKNTMLILSKFEGTYLIVLNFEGYVKYIQRWWFAQSNRIGKLQNIVKTFLSSKKILANDMNYPGIYNNINTQFRFAIGVEYNFFKRFVEVLVSALWQVEYDYREIDAKL